MLIKTRAALYDELEAAISELHPYELPEIIAFPIVRGSSRIPGMGERGDLHLHRVGGRRRMRDDGDGIIPGAPR